jgi:hypothetical protein
MEFHTRIVEKLGDSDGCGIGTSIVVEVITYINVRIRGT